MITPNQITILRVVLTIVVVIVFLQARSTAAYITAFILYIITGLTDLIDGKLARKFHLETNFGKIADPIADKFLVLSVLFAFAWRGVYSVWWIIPIALREILVTAARLYLLKKDIVVAAESAGKIKMVIQLVTLTDAFLVLATDVPIFQMLLIPLLAVTNALTVYSGLLFFRRNRVFA